MLSQTQKQTRLKTQRQTLQQPQVQTSLRQETATQDESQPEAPPTQLPTQLGTDLESQTKAGPEKQLTTNTQQETLQGKPELKTIDDTITEIQPETQLTFEPETQVTTEPENQLRTEPEAQLTTEPENQLRTEPEAQLITEPEAQLTTEPENQLMTEPEAQLITEPEAKLTTEPKAQLTTEPENQLRTEPEAQLITEPENQLRTEPEAQLTTEPEAQLTTEPEAQLTSDPETQLRTVPETKLRTLPETKLRTEPETQLTTEPEAQLTTEPENQLRTLPETKLRIEPETQLRTEPEAQLKTEPETQLRTEPEIQLTIEPEAQLRAEPEAQLRAEPEAQLATDPVAQLTTDPVAQLTTDPVAQLTTDPVAQLRTEPEIQVTTDPVAQLKTEPEIQVTIDPETHSEPHLTIEPQTLGLIQSVAQPEAQFVSQVNPVSECRPMSESLSEIQSKTPSPTAQVETQPRHLTLSHLGQYFLDQSHCVAVPGVQMPLSLLDHLLEKNSLVTTTARSPILSLPYPVEQSGADLQRAFPGQVGRFFVTNTFHYAYSWNRMSIEMAAECMGFVKCNFLDVVRPMIDQKTGTVTSFEKKIKSDPRLTLMILKPAQMQWTKLGNCLLLERSHPQRQHIADKWKMVLVLRRSTDLPHLQLTTARGEKFDYSQFILYTFNPGCYQQELMKYLDSHPGTYILKRTNYSQGIGIRMYQAEAPNSVEKLRRIVGSRVSLTQFVMQKYIERPLLVDKRKFDLRVYMLLLSCKRPLANGAPGFENSYFAFCYPGYVKLSCYPYNTASNDLHVHLTNQFVQKRRMNVYAKVKEATTWFPDELNEYLNHKRRAEVDWCHKRLYGQIRAITGYVAAAFRSYLDSNSSPASVFRLYGPDFIIDENLRVWLLEVNTFPSYAQNTTALSGSIRNMWREAVTLATEVTLRYRNRQPVEDLTTMRNFQMAYSSENPMLLADLVRQYFP